MLKFEEIDKQIARIKVIGVGGGGSNAVDHMADMGITGVDFAIMNTDVQVLGRSGAPEKIQIGKKTTRGMGTGGNPELGRQAALDDKDLIKESLEGVNILFITAGYGGGTGTGASPVVAQIAREMGILTVGVITKPFTFEGKRRMAQAEAGLKEFREQVNTIVCIPNDKVFNMISQDTPLYDAYRMTDQILYQAVESISRVIIMPGLINLDFADIQTILSIHGGAVIGFGEGTGKDKAAKAIQSALASPLLETRELSGAKGILISIVGGRDLSLYEVNNAIGSIHEIADDDANILIGAIIDNDITDRSMVTLIATGLATEVKEQSRPAKVSMPRSEQPLFEHARQTRRSPEPAATSTQTSRPDEHFARSTDRQEYLLCDDSPQDEQQAVQECSAEESQRATASLAEPVADTEPEPVAQSSAHHDTESIQEPDDNPISDDAASDTGQESGDEPEERPESEPEPAQEKEQHRQNVIQFNKPQGEFFEDTDPTVYAGRNLDIPAFLRKKRFAGRD